MTHRPFSIFAYVGLSALLAGCGQSPAPGPSTELLVVPVSHPIQREVTDFVDYTGRLAAINSVDIRPRVTGYLTKMPFREGAEVKAGDLLFQIDPRPYQALVDQAEAQVNLNVAQAAPGQGDQRAGQDRLRPRTGRFLAAGTRYLPGPGAGGRRLPQSLAGQPGSLQAQPQLLRGHLAH